METDKEDILIHRLLLSAAVLTVATVLGAVTVVAVMISYNFNFLEWME